MKTKHKKQRPTEIIVEIDADQGPKSVAVPIADFPSILFIPRFMRAGLIDGRPRSEAGLTVIGGFGHRFDVNTQEQLQRIGGSGFPSVSFQPWIFGKMLAKIAHAGAVSGLGYKRFVPYLPDIILGRNTDASYFVGSAPEIPPPALQGLHNLDVRVCEYGSRKLVVAYIRLFWFFPTPVFEVVAGEVSAQVPFT